MAKHTFGHFTTLYMKGLKQLNQNLKQQEKLQKLLAATNYVPKI